jgi:hypothetical protein
MMYAKQARAAGKSGTMGYMTGLLAGVSQFPGLREVLEQFAKTQEAWKQGSLTKLAETMNWDYESLQKFWSARLVPSFLNHDVRGLLKETKYDAFGRPIPKPGDSTYSAVMSFFYGANVKEDTSNMITREMDRLLLTENMPTLTPPTGKKVDSYVDKHGEEAYQRHLHQLQRNYADAVQKLINSRQYQRLSPEEQKKRIDEIRRKEIINRI